MKTVWIDRGWYPVKVAFCPDEAAWARLMKQMGPESCEYPPSPAGAACSAFEDQQGNRIVVVTIGDQIDDSVELVCALVHEAVHVWQRICEHIREKEPGWEPEAYAIQHITKGLLKAYADTRMPQ